MLSPSVPHQRRTCFEPPSLRRVPVKSASWLEAPCWSIFGAHATKIFRMIRGNIAVYQGGGGKRQLSAAAVLGRREPDCRPT